MPSSPFPRYFPRTQGGVIFYSGGSFCGVSQSDLESKIISALPKDRIGINSLQVESRTGIPIEVVLVLISNMVRSGKLRRDKQGRAAR
jgi:hypothetical protein